MKKWMGAPQAEGQRPPARKKLTSKNFKKRGVAETGEQAKSETCNLAGTKSSRGSQPMQNLDFTIRSTWSLCVFLSKRMTQSNKEN